MNALFPLVSDWFFERYGEPTEPQMAGWPIIRAGRDVLISAPTGSGKTLAAFTTALDSLVRRAAEGPLPDRTLVVYVSPLKALTNDIRKNLETPLGELLTLAADRGLPLAPIRTATRTGDTPPADRARMLRKPPHVLVTTPESLYIMLTAEKSRALFTHVETIIVDEIHAMAADKRGSPLALTLARLGDLVQRNGGAKPQRIGLSATVRPLAAVASFLSDTAEIVDVGSRRAMTLAVEVPADEFGAVTTSEMWAEFYNCVAALVRERCGALVHAMRNGAMDALRIPVAPLDVLAQQLVATCAGDDWDVDELFALVRSTQPYRDLPRKDFDDVLAMLADGIATSRGRSGAFLHHDRVNGRVRARRGSRMAAIMSGGAIPETANYTVVAEPEGTVIGNVDEDFAIESLAGDVFLLGTTSWMIRRVESGTVRVENAHGAPPSIPFWNGEGLGRTVELSHEVAVVRAAIDTRTDADAFAWLEERCAFTRPAAEQAVAYIRMGKAILGAVPTETMLVAERFFDEGGGMQLILHTPFGARINRAWGLALRKKFCRSFNVELQAAANDNGIVLSLTEQHAFPLEIVFEYVKSASVETTLTQALLTAPMFGARWRWNATRALAILRMRAGKKVAPQIQRMRADDLLAACFPDAAACGENLTGPIRFPDHVLVRETIDNCLREAMDIDGLHAILGRIERGEITTRAVDTPEPSVFCHELLNANPYAFLDDAPLEERRARAVTLRRTTRADADASSILNPAAIAEVAESSWPLVRDADELHDALLTLCVVPPADACRGWFDELVAQHRATTLQAGETPLWTCAERLPLTATVYPTAAAQPELAALTTTLAIPATREEGVAEILRGWLESTGPTTVAELSTRLAIDAPTIDAALIRLETEGQVLRGHFRSQDDEWCNRRVLSRIHRLTIGTLRREIEPVSTADYVRFLYRWQHVAPGSRLHGVDGTLHVIRQLEGYELPAAAWETSVLPARVADYRKEYLDQLCYAGDVMWGRLSPHPALTPPPSNGRRRSIRSTKLAPIALFARENADALPDAIEALRAARRSADHGDVVEVGAYDPLALAKSLMPVAPPRPLHEAVS